MAGDQRKIYALAIGANRRTLQVGTSSYSVRAARAVSEEEAIGIGVRSALKAWPPEEGWSEHQATVCEVPEEWYS